MTREKAGHALAAYFPELDDKSTAFAAHISLFDHWLSEAESSSARALCYEAACERHALADYCEGEQRFLRLYDALARGGLVCYRPGPQRTLDGDDPELHDIFRASLREQSFMDVYFKASATRVLGRWDRSDYVIFSDTTDIASFQALVEGHGLYLLFDPAGGVAH